MLMNTQRHGMKVGILPLARDGKVIYGSGCVGPITEGRGQGKRANYCNHLSGDIGQYLHAELSIFI